MNYHAKSHNYNVTKFNFFGQFESFSALDHFELGRFELGSFFALGHFELGSFRDGSL
jgi:hypothetical protein